MELTNGEKKYLEAKRKFCIINSKKFSERLGESNIGAVVVITKDTFDKEYSLESRSYGFNSCSKAFCSWMGGYSIFASSLDGSDRGVRIEGFLAVERGGEDGWRIEDFYFVKDNERVDSIETFDDFKYYSED